MRRTVRTDPVAVEGEPCGLSVSPGLLEVGKQAATRAERSLILATLEETRWNRRRAAGLLKVSYKTLLNKIKEYGLAEPSDP